MDLEFPRKTIDPENINTMAYWCQITTVLGILSKSRR